MPQDGSNNYQYPPGTPGIPDTTIESEAYNTFLDDLVTNDLNIARPIHRGGTGATTAHQALINLKGEEALQNVTNYDTHPFVSGSFNSLAAATAAPTTGAFSGICYTHTTAGDMTLEARAVDSTTSPGDLYVRQKRAGVWSAWVKQLADLDAAYVNIAGDTMTGSLIIRAASPYFNLDRPVVAATSNTIVGSIADKARWGINLGDSVAETGSNTGTNFSVSRFNDDGSFLDVPLVISRTTGNVAFKSNVTAGAGSSAASYSFGAAGVKYLGYDGTNFNFVGGAAILTPMLNVTGGVMFDISKDLGFRAYEGGVNQRYYSYSATYYMHWDGNNGDYRIVLNNAERLRISNASGNVSISGAIQSDNGRIISHGGAPSIVVFDGGSAQGFWMGPSILYFGSATGDGGPAVTWGSLSAGALVAYNDGQKPGGGPWTALSDARIKNVESDYTQSLAEIIQLNPVNYTYKGNDTPVAPTHALDAPPTKDEPTVPYPNSAHYSAATEQKKFVGLVAQEVKAIFPEMVKLSDGYIDGQPVTDLHNLDTTPLIFALVNAIKELNARIEALEAQ